MREPAVGVRGVAGWARSGGAKRQVGLPGCDGPRACRPARRSRRSTRVGCRAPVVQQLKTLASGAFLKTATNVLALACPGVGKGHALCAVAHALVESGHSVLCVPAYALVQELLGASWAPPPQQLAHGARQLPSGSGPNGSAR